MKVSPIQAIASKKGFRFEFDEADNSYVLYDKATGLALMTYATITVKLITSEHKWREEFNKFRTEAYK
jgi:hypothetical protein